MDLRLSTFYAGRLRQIFLYLTYSCPFRCNHCLIGDRRGSFYAASEVRNILMMLRSHGAAKVTLLGGEPTVHPHLTEVIDAAKSLGYQVVLDTNGSFPPALFASPAFRSLDAI